MEHVLGYLARRFSVSEENIASEALTWVLRDPEARAALISLVRGAGVKIPDELSFVGQVGDPDTGRPDIVGTDSAQSERLIIEAKFAAKLTDLQPNGYLKRLNSSAPSMLLVLAPSARRRTLWPELLRAVPNLAATAPSPSSVSGDAVFKVEVESNITLALTSWRHLVTHLLEALRSGTNQSLAHDVEQLLALTDVMDSQAYAPVSPGDYGPDEARRIQQLERLIDGVAQRARSSSVVEHDSTRPSHGRSSTAGIYGAVRRAKRRGSASFLARGHCMGSRLCGWTPECRLRGAATE